MPKLVQDAGGELSAGYIMGRCRLYNRTSDEQQVGGRLVKWRLSPRGVDVTHPSVSPSDPRAAYSLPVVATRLPSGGDRIWWSCPGCARRVDSLYLPPERPQLGCRRCCGLKYRSQYSTRRVSHRKKRPVATRTVVLTSWDCETGWSVTTRVLR
jgi:hypothetical protein